MSAELRRLARQATLLKADEAHAELDAAARRSGFTDEQIAHAHKVARGEAPLSEACPQCEEQELYYARGIMWEGHTAIICQHCGCTCVDRNEQGGVAEDVAAKVMSAHKAGKIKGIVGG